MTRQKSPEEDPSYRKELYKGHKGMRGKPIYYEELKRRISITLTPTALKKLEDLASEAESSRSEVIERWLKSKKES